MRIYFLLFILLSSFGVHAQNLKAYQIYDIKGNQITFQNMADRLAGYDVVLFGEYHNNAIIHWLELQLTKALYLKNEEKLVLGAEMFERDNQEMLNQYLNDTAINTLNPSIRLWPNYKTDYKPIVDFAGKHQLQFIASNVPRRYAQIVARKGWDTLYSSVVSDSEKAYMVKLPIVVDMATPGYREMEEMMQSLHSDASARFVAAQALKDATMAESILNNRRKGELFLHFNGDYHSKEFGGIYWYLKKQEKNLNVAVISIAESDQPELKLPDNFVPTDYIIVVPTDMAKSY